jgi:hypothetical protein
MTSSNLFQNSNPGPAEVCLSPSSVASADRIFASHLKRGFTKKSLAIPKHYDFLLEVGCGGGTFLE